MITINNIKLNPGFSEAELLSATAKKLGITAEDILHIQRLRQAVDARNKTNVHYNLSVAAKLKPGTKPTVRSKDISPPNTKAYAFPFEGLTAKNHPVVVGSGPAGQFCALMLARAGLKPILVERGQAVAQRARDVSGFFATGSLNVESNIQFGEGGAGTFSDGKLNTGTRDIRHRFILEQFCKAGAPEDVLYLAKPHIGTDVLRHVVVAMRQEIQALGGQVLFGTRLAELNIQSGVLRGIYLQNASDRYHMDASALVLATGHSARDTYEMLHRSGVVLAQKNFAVGVRIEHLQQQINMAQYGSVADFKALPAAEYKVVAHGSDARSVFSFCVCPGGNVVGAASEQGMVVTNGMSEHARDGELINGALLVGVTPADFSDAHPLAGIAYQRQLELAAYRLGGGGFVAPAQLVGDFLAERPSAKAGRIAPTYRPGVKFTELRQCLPDYITQALQTALPQLGRKIKGFDAQDAVLTAVESRSSSPVRILRNECYEANIQGVFPCGEGAGYAGGIISAAADGIRCAEAVCAWL